MVVQETERLRPLTDAELDNMATALIQAIRVHHKEQLEPWIATQIASIKQKEKHSCIGGEFAYTITPTTLGVIVVVSCEMTGERLNVTDFSNW